jgi:lipoprotein-releasing system permease protein
LNLAYFISRRISRTTDSSFSRLIHKIAIASIALGLAVMLISVLILQGFQQTISDKVVSFGGHLQISRFSPGMQTYEQVPISTNQPFLKNAQEFPYLAHVQAVAYKPGLLKTKDEVQGVVLKGVGADFDTLRFAENLIEGQLPASWSDTSVSTEVVISQNIARLMRLKLNDEAIMYFVQNPPRFRRLKISGIYSTGMEDYDNTLIFGDIGLVRQLNNWADTLTGSFELFVKDFDQLDAAQEDLFEKIDYNYAVERIIDRNLQTFEWLDLLNRNVVIFLALILFVASFNMISILLILIMERTPMIGTLMAMGASGGLLKRIFVSNGMLLVLKGMLWGNVIGLGLGFLQYQFRLIPLEKENYYMDFVPILWDWPAIIMLNFLIFLIVLLVLLVPAIVISRIQPIAAIKFD